MRLSLPVINPATESVVAERAGFLGKIYDLILERKEPLAQALSLEMGAAIGFARAMQLTALAVNATSIR